MRFCETTWTVAYVLRNGMAKSMLGTFGRLKGRKVATQDLYLYCKSFLFQLRHNLWELTA